MSNLLACCIAGVLSLRQVISKHFGSDELSDKPDDVSDPDEDELLGEGDGGGARGTLLAAPSMLNSVFCSPTCRTSATLNMGLDGGGWGLDGGEGAIG